MKKTSSIQLTKIGALVLLSSAAAFAQVYTPPAPPSPIPGGQQGGETKPNSYAGQDKPESKSIYGNELPFIDPHDETITLNGKSWSMGDNRLIAARFEKYLNEPEDSSEEATAYRAIIKKLLDLLSPRNIPNNIVSQAVGLLTQAAAYPGDAQLSDTLTQVIYTSHLSKSGRNAKKEAISELEAENARIVRAMSLLYDKIQLSGPNANTRGKPGENRNNRISDPRYINYGKRLVEIEALKKKYEGETIVSLAEAKIHYQAALVQFFMQRRFEHVVIGARLYNYIFNDGNSRLSIKQGSDADKLFSDSFGMPPTVATLDALASEAIRDCNRHMEAVQYLLDKKELVGASKRLSEAFMLGEFLPPVTTFPRTEKRRVQEFLRTSYKLISAIDAKDYAGAQELVKRLKTEAEDFDAVKAETAIAAYTRASDMHLFNAQQAFMEGDKERGETEVKQAIEIWPRNPKLDELNKTLLNTNQIILAKQDFQRFLSEGNFRQIYREQYRFAPVVQGDAEMEDAFTQIIRNITRIEMSIEKAKEFSKMGQDYAAWEELKQLRDDKTFSQDPELGKQIEDLVPRVSELTSALDKARRLEEMQETGSALAWYIKARHVYPNSKFAKSGIDRLLDEVLPQGGAAQPQ